MEWGQLDLPVDRRRRGDGQKWLTLTSEWTGKRKFCLRGRGEERCGGGGGKRWCWHRTLALLQEVDKLLCREEGDFTELCGFIFKLVVVF